jgi:cellulose synthase operon protein C
MRTFNVRLAGILLGIVVVLGISVYFLHKHMVYSNASFFLVESKEAEERAAAAAKDKNAVLQAKATKEAIDYLQWYVGLIPRQYDQMEHLGILLADKAQRVGDRQTFWQAYGTLENTVRLAPKQATARRRLVAMAMQPNVRRYQDAQDHLERFLLVDAPKDPELLEQLGVCQVGLGNYAQAEASFKKAIAANEHQVMAYPKLAEALRFHLSKPKQADECMDKLVKINPKSAKAHYYRASYLASPAVHRNDEAVKEAFLALDLAPDDTDILLLVAGCYMAEKKFDKARECLARGIKLHPTEVGMYKALSELEQRAGNRDEALAVLQRGIKATDRNSDLMWYTANMLVDANKLAESRALLDELQRKSCPKPMIEYVDARIELAQQHWPRALERLESVRGAMVLDPQRVKMIDYWIAICYGALGNHDQQEQALRRALATDPSFKAAAKALAELDRMKGDVDDSLKQFLERYRRNQLEPAEMVQMAQLLLVRTMQQKAADRKWEPIEQLLDKAEKSLPDAAEIAVLRANILAVQDRAAEAEKLLLKARDKDPKQVAPWKALLAIALQRKDADQVEQLLTDAGKAMGDTVVYRLLVAESIAPRRGDETMQRLRKLADKVEQFSDNDRMKLWSGLLGAALVAGDAMQANALAQKIAEKQPNNVQVRQFIFEKAITSGDVAAAERALKELEIVTRQDSYWFYGNAVLSFLKAKDSKEPGPLLDEALGFLTKARAARKDWSRIALLEGQIFDQQHKTEAALKSYMEAIDLGDRNPVAIQRVSEILMRSQRLADAERLIRKLEGERGSLPRKLLQDLAVIALQQGNIERAIDLTRNAVSADSKDYKELAWQGQMFGFLGKQIKDRGRPADAADAAKLFDDGEKALRQAAELAPKLPVVWVALVQFLVMASEEDKADAAIQDAKASLAPKDIPLTLAQCYEKVNKFDAAQEQYEAALKASPQDIEVVRTVADFYRRAQKLPAAEALLRQILDGKVPGKEADTMWARREMAKVLAAHGGYPELQKAIHLIEQNMTSTEPSVVDRQFLARLLASDPQPSAHDKAIELFKSLGPSATSDDRFLLAKMYLNAGNWIEGSSLLRGLVASNPKDARYLEYYIGELLKHNEVSSARTYCDLLMQLAPNAFVAVSRNADVLCATNQASQAFDALKDFVDNVDALPRDRSLRLRVVANKLGELGDQLKKPSDKAVAEKCISQAEILLRTYAKENVGQDLLLAIFLGTHGKIDEGLGIIEEYLQTGNAEDFAQSCSLIVQSGTLSREQMQRVGKLLDAAEKKFERTTPLLLARAELRTHQTLYADAVAAYREALQKAPDNAFALNNLAVLLALQRVDLDEALKLVNQAIEKAGPIGPMLDSRATVYMALNKPDKALEDMTAAVAEQETLARLFHLAQAYELTGDKAKARKVLDAALAKGLVKETLQPLEAPTFEKLKQLPK